MEDENFATSKKSISDPNVDNNSIIGKGVEDIKDQNPKIFHIGSESTSNSDVLIESQLNNDDEAGRFKPKMFDGGYASERQLKYDQNLSFLNFFYCEVTKGYGFEQEETKFTNKRKRVYAFIKIPRELEKFMVFGFLQCLDVFLYQFTLMPIRFVISVLYIARIPFSSCWKNNGLDPAQICDFLKGFIFVITCVIMFYVDVSMMYHIIRGQAIIKLYIFFNMLEVADRLFSSFGQDIVDSLYWTATEPRGRKREHVGILPHLALAIVYVFLHTMLTLFQATTLNVAFNSHNKALLTIMMSNNFVELKGSVFKKFEKNNLFQMSCADVRERFHFLVLLSVVCVRNMTEFSWNTDHLWDLIPDVAMVMISEAFVDWVKHAFITKFNDIPSEVYGEYTRSIAYDLVNSRKTNAIRDHLDAVSRRMGFMATPLAVLLVRVLWQSLPFSGGVWGILTYVIVFICLTSFKITLSIFLLSRSFSIVENDLKSNSKQNTPSGSFCRDNTPSRHLLHSNSTVSMHSVTAFDAAQTTVTSQPARAASAPIETVLDRSDEDDGRDGRDTTSTRRRRKPPLDDIERYTMCSNRIT